MMKRAWSVAWRTGLILLIATVVGTLLLCAAYAIPTDKMTDNVRESATILNQEGNYPNCFNATMDNASVGIIFNMAYNDGFLPKTNILTKALSNYIITVNEYNSWGINNFYALVTGYENSSVSYFSYGRYWNGHLIYAKPLLALFNYQQIRIFNTVVITLLIFVVIVTMFFKCRPLLIPYVLTLLLNKPFVMGLCLMYLPCLVIYHVGILLVLWLANKIKLANFIYVFLILGILICYFDLLTYPLVTLLIPLIVLIYLKNDELPNFKTKILFLIKMCIFWLIGYAGFFLIKWTLQTVVTGVNCYAVAFDELFYRMNGNNRYEEILPEGFRLLTFKWNLDMFLWSIKKYLIIFCAIYFLLYLLKCSLQKRNYIFQIKIDYLYLLIMLCPYIWYVLVANHSAIHSFFTCYLQVATVFAGLAWFVSCIEPVKQVQAVGEGANIISSEGGGNVNLEAGDNQAVSVLGWRGRLKKFVCTQPLQFGIVIAGLCLMLAYVFGLPCQWAIVVNSAQPLAFVILAWTMVGLAAVAVGVGGFWQYFCRQKGAKKVVKTP